MNRCELGSKSYRSLSIILSVIFVGWQALATNAKDNAKESLQSSKYVTIPIYYLTDREIKGDSYGVHRRYPGECQHQMYYGTAFVSVPNTKKKTQAELFNALGWQFSDSHPAKIAQKDRVDPTDYEKAKAEFFDRLKMALNQTGKPDLCLYVHGSCDPFEDSAQDAAGMAYALEKPVVMYSWPSGKRWRGYYIDGVNSEWSQAHFNQFCKDLLVFKAEHPLNVISISHSMGNRLVIRALPVVYGKELMNDFELVSPDIDAAICRHYTMGYDKVKAKIRLYVSNRDKMLSLAQLLSGGYYRLGEAAMPTLGGTYIKANLLERIDFTAVDTGFTGHTIPFDLIASMIATNKPGEKLALVPEKTVRANRLTRFAGGSEDSASISNEAPDFCSRVVRTK
jgi:esterase/lipase superfamily enzyme